MALVTPALLWTLVFFDALHRVARDLQIIVFTCRQRAFEKLGGEWPRIEVSAE